MRIGNSQASRPACLVSGMVSKPLAPRPYGRYVGRVKSLGQLRRFASVFLLAVVAPAWFLASNHCALTAMENPRIDGRHDCCHSEKEPAQSKGQSARCCEDLAAPMPVAAAAPALHLKELPLYCAGQIEPLVAASLAVGFSEGAGPPQGVPCFAVLVLNRSLLSHAPPRSLA